MRLFWELSKLSFARQLNYRAATLAGLVTNLFFGLLRAAVLEALYGSREEVVGISLQAAITYTGVTQALIAFTMIFGWYEVMDSVYSGEVASDLLKPMNYFTFWLARDVGRAVATFLLRGLTIMAAYALIFPIIVPQGAEQWLALVVALILALLVSFAWRFLVNLAAFWTPNALGIGRFAFILSWFLSGFLMPLRFFPDWFQAICSLTPFPQVVNTVVEVYLGLLTGADLLRALGVQLLWAIGLILASQLVLRAGVRRLVILGG
ncbi:MAG: ABC-2 family transporter protein [Ardenticatenales bacterium]|nr:ABC-2 family transporter protein [Ardenticatenales bacterium]